MLLRALSPGQQLPGDSIDIIQLLRVCMPVVKNPESCLPPFTLPSISASPDYLQVIVNMVFISFRTIIA
jgi:hypothetical protein